LFTVFINRFARLEQVKNSISRLGTFWTVSAHYGIIWHVLEFILKCFTSRFARALSHLLFTALSVCIASPYRKTLPILLTTR
jgi:hypothetical protein